MKKIHIGLLPRIIIAIILGIAIGNFLPTPLVRLFVTFNSIFGEFLNFSIPLIILGLVTIAIEMCIRDRYLSLSFDLFNVPSR